MTLRAVRRLLLGILGGIGAVFLAASAAIMAISRGMLSIPAQATSDSAALPVLTVTFGGVGLVLLGLGLGIFIVLRRGEKQREELFLYGHVVDGVVESIRCNPAITVNNRHPWHVYVTCRHPVTREDATLRSHSIYTLTVHQGDRVRVAFDPLDERKYAIDIPERNARA